MTVTLDAATAPCRNLPEAPRSATYALAATNLPELAGKQADLKTYFTNRAAAVSTSAEPAAAAVSRVPAPRPLKKRAKTMMSFFSSTKRQANAPLKGATPAAVRTPAPAAAPTAAPGASLDAATATATATATASAKTAWKAMFTGPIRPPLCAHGEAAIERTVVKKGPRFGTKFYCCARPEGSKNDPNARCSFFYWMKDHHRAVKKHGSNKDFDFGYAARRVKLPVPKPTAAPAAACPAQVERP